MPHSTPIASVLQIICIFWIAGPANPPGEVLGKLQAAANAAVHAEVLKKCIPPDGSRGVAGLLGEFRAFLLADIEKWEKVLNATGTRPA